MRAASRGRLSVPGDKRNPTCGIMPRRSRVSPTRNPRVTIVLGVNNFNRSNPMIMKYGVSRDRSMYLCVCVCVYEKERERKPWRPRLSRLRPASSAVLNNG